MAKRRTKLTSEERARLDAEHERVQAMVRERIEYHTRMAELEEERRARRARRWAPLRRLLHVGR
jgi:hypothetical protein